MKLKNILKLALPIMSLTFGYSCKERSDNLHEKIIVDAGTFEIGKGEFLSKNFYGCSAIIFDYGDSAIFSHAYRGTAYNSINEILSEVGRKKIAKKNLSVYIFSGDSKDLQEISKKIPKDVSIKKEGIYKKFKSNRDEIYDIEFNSLTNKYKIKAHKFL